MTAEKQPLICCICNQPIPPQGNWLGGNNAEPIANGRCCKHCDDTVVIPARIVATYKTGLRR